MPEILNADSEEEARRLAEATGEPVTFPLPPLREESFFQAYVTTALWSSVNGEGQPLDDDHGPTNVAPETLDSMRADCNRFLSDNAETIQAAIDTGGVKAGPDFDAWGRAGHDFWLTRCGHGAGFWDGDWPEPMATVLSDAARGFGGVDLYVGDDGMIYSEGG